MSDAISILRGNQELRIQDLIAMLRKAPARAKAFVAGEESDGVIPVTLGSRLSADLVVIWERGFTANCWDPARFQNEFNQGIHP